MLVNWWVNTPSGLPQALHRASKLSLMHKGWVQGLVGPMRAAVFGPRALGPSWDRNRWPFGLPLTSGSRSIVLDCWRRSERNESVCVSCMLSTTLNAPNTLYSLLITCCYDRKCRRPLINHSVRRFLCNVEWIPLQIIHSINKQIKFTCQGCNNETLPSVWPRSEGSNTSKVYCCQLKFSLLFCFLWERVWSWKVILCGIWQLCFIYFLVPCLFFSSRNSLQVEEPLTECHERLLHGNSRWATYKGHAKLECVHLSRDDSGLISAACCRGKEGGCCRYSFDISVSGILITPYYPALFVVCFKDQIIEGFGFMLAALWMLLYGFCTSGTIGSLSCSQ